MVCKIMKLFDKRSLSSCALFGFKIFFFALSLSFFTAAVNAQTLIQGRVLDKNGQPVSGSMVTLNQKAPGHGADALTVFTDDKGHFTFPEHLAKGPRRQLSLYAKALNFVQVTANGQPLALATVDLTKEIVLVMQRKINQAQTVPASAWLRDMENTPAKGNLIIACVNCHQFPTPEVKDFTLSLNDIETDNPRTAREQSWHAMFQYMRFKFGDVIARGIGQDLPYEVKINPGNYSFNRQDEDEVVPMLASQMPSRFDVLKDFDYGAQLAVNAGTVIREYTVSSPNAIREALSSGDGNQLWAADFYGEKLVHIDAKSGQQTDFKVPFERNTGPHTLLRGNDGSLWLAGIFESFIGQLEPETGQWRVWTLKSKPAPVPHDLSYNFHNELATDLHGRIWYSDSGNNRLGYFHPENNEEGSFPAPIIAGRTEANMLMYGLVMTSGRQRICYTQLGGHFGCFNTETMQLEKTLEFPRGAGPRRMAIDEHDRIYIPLFGSGQLVEYDGQALEKLATYDLPDRASGPYAATWDPVRRVVWIATSNADVLYRFDPETKAFGVIPLPHPKAYLRMIAVDPKTGYLVSSYGNLPEDVDGPRTVLVVDPGDAKYK